MSSAEGGYGYMLGPSVFNWVNHQFLPMWCYILLASASGHGSYRSLPSCNKAFRRDIRMFGINAEEPKSKSG